MRARGQDGPTSLQPGSTRPALHRAARAGDALVWSSRLTALALLLCATLLVVQGTAVRGVEARVQAALLTVFGIDASALGQAVLFPLDGRWVGVAFSIGCSVAPIAALFLGASAVAAWLRPLPVSSVALGVGGLALLFMLANQLRIAVIVAMMRSMGFERGYEFSHIFLGSAISTLGFVAAVLLFVRLVLRSPAVRP